MRIIGCGVFVHFAGHPRRHLLTTGWSVFVSTKRLVAGDSVLFLRYVFPHLAIHFLLCSEDFVI